MGATGKEWSESMKGIVKGCVPHGLRGAWAPCCLEAGRRLRPPEASGGCPFRALLPLGSSPCLVVTKSPSSWGHSDHTWQQHSSTESLLVLACAGVGHGPFYASEKQGIGGVRCSKHPEPFLSTWEAQAGLADCMSQTDTTWQVSFGLLLLKSESEKRTPLPS